MRIYFFGILLLSFLGGSSCGDPAPVTDADGWMQLFNGTNLDGWVRMNGSAPFTIADGIITGKTKKGEPNSFLGTKKKYGDFILEMEVKIDPYLNSGIQIRSNSYTDYLDGKVHGYQVDIDPSERGWTGGIYDEARRGWLFPMGMNKKAAQAFKPKEWNKIYIEAIGPYIKTWVNDIPASYLIDDLTKEGFIALQIHSVGKQELYGRAIQWKNIRLKTQQLEPRMDHFPYVVNNIPNTLTKAEQDLGWINLFEGGSLEQWRGAHQESFPLTGWENKDGILKVLESGGGESEAGGDIVTRDEFNSFEFQLEFNLSEGANSGIKYFVTETYGDHPGSAIGLEFQLLDDANHPDAKQGIDGNRTMGSLYDLITAVKPDRFVNAPGKWNHARIVVQPDNHVEHWLNHVKVLEYQRGSSKYRNLVRNSKYKDWKDFGMAKQGHILLQDHGNEVKFRSIKVRHLYE